MNNHQIANAQPAHEFNAKAKLVWKWLVESELEIFMTICIVTFILLIFILSNPENFMLIQR